MNTGENPYPGRVLSAILRHDAKTASYKIALVRALGDVALAFPDVGRSGLPVAVPLTALARFWVAYYWPFVHPDRPIWQGRRRRLAAGFSSDMAFRDALARLVLAWEAFLGASTAPSDGYLLINELRIARKRAHYPATLVRAYDGALHAIAKTVQMPIRYAGQGEWRVFPPPVHLSDTRRSVESLPGAGPSDLCVLVSPDLWRDFQQLSLWIEALSIHEWCLYTESVAPSGGSTVTRGEVYQLLTDRPDNRRPLTWERNQIDILLMEGQVFCCPWTEKRIADPGAYDLDHLVPVAIYPINEMWNLVPADAYFNQYTKRDRLPSADRLQRATPILAATYSTYTISPTLARALRDDSLARFAGLSAAQPDLCVAVATAATHFVERVADARNLGRF